LATLVFPTPNGPLMNRLIPAVLNDLWVG
jgi:hypothetical protein